MKHYVIPIFVIFYCNFLVAQKTISASDFLAITKSDIEVVAEDEKLKFLENKDYSLPLLQDLQLRTETNDFILREQEYAVRIKLNSTRQKDAYQKLHEATIHEVEIEKQFSLKSGLEEKYKLLVDYQFIPFLIADQKELLQLLKQKQAVLRAEVSSLDFDLEGIVKTEEAIYEAELDVLTLTQKYDIVKSKIAAIADTDSIAMDFISLKELQVIYPTLKKNAFVNTLLYDRFQQEKERIAAEYDIEEAEIGKILDFVQLRAGPRQTRVFREEFSIGVGLRVPLKGDKKLDLLELELEALNEEFGYKVKQQGIEKRTSIYLEKIEQLFFRYNLIETQTENSQAKYALDRYKQMSDISAIQILRLQEILLEKRIALQRIEYDIFETYLDWIRVSEVIVQSPLKNYLTPDLEQF